MKNNEEFLRGVYEKAEILNNEGRVKEKKTSIYLRYSSIAALFILIPILIMQGNLKEDTPLIINEPRIMSYGNIDQSFLEADYIVMGRVEGISVENNEVEISIKVDEDLLGKQLMDTIVVNGADFISDGIIVNQIYIFLLYEAEEQLYLYKDLEGLLVKDDSDSFIDIFGNRYSVEDVRNNIDGRR